LATASLLNESAAGLIYTAALGIAVLLFVFTFVRKAWDSRKRRD
jgi:DMSO reductase anchor subunit